MTSIIPENASQWPDRFRVRRYPESNRYCDYNPSLLNEVPDPLHGIHVAYAFARTTAVTGNALERRNANINQGDDVPEKEDFDRYWSPTSTWGGGISMDDNSGSIKKSNITKIITVLKGIGAYLSVGDSNLELNPIIVCRSKIRRSYGVHGSSYSDSDPCGEFPYVLASSSDPYDTESASDDSSSDDTPGTHNVFDTEELADNAAPGLFVEACEKFIRLAAWINAPAEEEVSELRLKDIEKIFNRAKEAKWYMCDPGISISICKYYFTSSLVKLKYYDESLGESQIESATITSGSCRDYLDINDANEFVLDAHSPISSIGGYEDVGGMPNKRYVDGSEYTCPNGSADAFAMFLFKVKVYIAYVKYDQDAKVEYTEDAFYDYRYEWRCKWEYEDSWVVYVAVPSNGLSFSFSDGGDVHRNGGPGQNKLLSQEEVVRLIKTAIYTSNIPYYKPQGANRVKVGSDYKKEIGGHSWVNTGYTEDYTGVHAYSIDVEYKDVLFFFKPGYLAKD